MSELRGGEIKVWYVPQIPMQPFEVIVPDLRTARIVLDALVMFSCFEFRNHVKPDYADVGGVCRFEGGTEDGEWVDVEDDELEAVR
jgi:Superinfection exclusion gene product 17